jgi:hypothetical protein
MGEEAGQEGGGPELEGGPHNRAPGQAKGPGPDPGGPASPASGGHRKDEKWQQELEDKASNIALTEKNL